jgi:anaerobic dimethyl sulfoxide reductase subunit B (iron-sulfur subunit)
MKKGFIFNYDLCVSCKACVAACLLENNWSVLARKIYTRNGETFLPEPVINLSLACNHCDDPQCLYGCPSSAYYRDPQSEAVIIDSQKCIGCRYCLWNCPYDAPRFNIKKGYIEKCHFCYHRLKEGTEPACTSSCPTGALGFGEIPEADRLNEIKWISGKNLKPALHLTGNETTKPLEIVPEIQIVEKPGTINPGKLKNISKEWSLIVFSFLTIFSVAINLTDIVAGKTSDRIDLVLITLAGLLSLFHLRTRTKAWRALINIVKSPLSREIALLIAYAFLLFTAELIVSPPVRIISAVVGLLLLITIDSVYTYSDRSSYMLFHSGQSFISGLLIASFIMTATLPFIFIASVKLLFNLIALKKARSGNLYFSIRFVRMALLIISSMVIITGASKNIIACYTIFATGELLDRIMYYIDLEPINITNAINETIIPFTYEKERN